MHAQKVHGRGGCYQVGYQLVTAWPACVNCACSMFYPSVSRAGGMGAMSEGHIEVSMYMLPLATS